MIVSMIYIIVRHAEEMVIFIAKMCANKIKGKK